MDDTIKIQDEFIIKIDGKIILTKLNKLKKDDDPKIPNNIKDVENLIYLEENL
jgi:hypothetical protein